MGAGHGPYQIVAGATVQKVSAVASAATALPDAADGKDAKLVLVVADGSCYIDFGPAAVVAAAATSIQLPPDFPMVFNTSGCTHFAVIDLDASVKVNVSPLENN